MFDDNQIKRVLFFSIWGEAIVLGDQGLLLAVRIPGFKCLRDAQKAPASLIPPLP